MSTDTNEQFVVNFRGSMRDVRARMLWQRLFDFYREQGCPLDHMDNMLIDLRNCVEAMDGLGGGSTRFLWGCTPGHCMTTWQPDGAWINGDVELTCEWANGDWFVLCELSEDEARFTVLGNTDEDSNG